MIMNINVRKSDQKSYIIEIMQTETGNLQKKNPAKQGLDMNWKEK